MKGFYLGLFSIMIYIFQTTLGSFIHIFGFRIDWIFVYMIAVSLLFEFKYSIIIAIISGIMVDAMSSLGFGVHLCGYVIIVSLIFMLAAVLYKRNLIVAMIFSFVFTVFMEYLIYFLLLSNESALAYATFNTIFPQAFINMFFMIFVFLILALVLTCKTKKKKGGERIFVQSEE